MKKVLVVVNAVGVTPVVCQEFSRRTVWEETVRRVASSAEYDALLVRLAGEGVLPPECGLPELRVSGNGSHAVLTALSGDHPGYDWYVFVSLSSAFLDPSLIGHFVQVGERQLAHYVYGEHFPRGMAPEVLSAEALTILCGVSSGRDFPFSDEAIFDLMGLDINSWDIEMVVSEHDFRRMRLDLRVMTSEAAARMRSLLTLDPGLADGWSWERLSLVLRSHPEILRTLPAYVEFDLLDTCQLACRFCPRTLLLPAAERVVSLDEARRVIDELARLAPGATLALSPFSEPLLHPECGTIIRMVLDAGLRLVLETNGLALDQGMAALLAAADPERCIVIVSLDFSDPVRYENEKGSGLLGLAEENLRRLFSLRQRNVWLQAIQFEQDDAALDAFYEKWKEYADAILPRKYNTWCHRLPGNPAVDLSPLVRTPCWHLARDLVIRPDGSVGMCKQDPEGRVFSGNVFSEGLAAVWQRLDEQWQRHCGDEVSRGDDLCRVCDEWHTFNF